MFSAIWDTANPINGLIFGRFSGAALPHPRSRTKEEANDLLERSMELVPSVIDNYVGVYNSDERSNKHYLMYYLSENPYRSVNPEWL